MAEAFWQRTARRVRRRLYRYLAAEVVATARDVTAAEQASALRTEQASRTELAAALRSELAAERDGTRDRFAALESAIQELRGDLGDHKAAQARLAAVEIHVAALRAQASADRSAADARFTELERAATALFERFERQGDALGERMTKLERLREHPDAAATRRSTGS